MEDLPGEVEGPEQQVQSEQSRSSRPGIAVDQQGGAGHGICQKHQEPADFFVKVKDELSGKNRPPYEDLRENDLQHHRPGEPIDPFDAGCIQPSQECRELKDKGNLGEGCEQSCEKDG